MKRLSIQGTVFRMRALNKRFNCYAWVALLPQTNLMCLAVVKVLLQIDCHHFMIED